MRLIGRREFADFPNLGLSGIEAKIDTGAYTSALHCTDIEVKSENEKNVLCFRVFDDSHPEFFEKVHRFEEYSRKVIKNSFGEMEERYVIKTLVRFGGKKISCTLSLSDREGMRYALLIGRRLLKAKFVVDVNKIHTGGVKIKQALKDY